MCRYMEYKDRHAVRGLQNLMLTNKKGWYGDMNGINYNALMGNFGLYSNQSGNVTDDAIARGVASSAARNAESRNTDNGRRANADRDTYEYSGEARTARAGYERPQQTDTRKEYKALDSNGVQEGIKLSDAAKDYLAELREKYKNMDISVAEWSTDEEQDYYASLSSKAYSVLINPELLEKMATDESVRAEYEAVIGGADEKFETIKSELGEDADKIKGFSITMDKDGKVSYAVQLLKDMNDASSTRTGNSASKQQQERVNERRAERKRAEEERLEKIQEKRQETERIEAETIEELIQAIRDRLHPEEEEPEEDVIIRISEESLGLAE